MDADALDEKTGAAALGQEALSEAASENMAERERWWWLLRATEPREGCRLSPVAFNALSRTNSRTPPRGSPAVLLFSPQPSSLLAMFVAALRSAAVQAPRFSALQIATVAPRFPALARSYGARSEEPSPTLLLVRSIPETQTTEELRVCCLSSVLFVLSLVSDCVCGCLPG